MRIWTICALFVCTTLLACESTPPTATPDTPTEVTEKPAEATKEAPKEEGATKPPPMKEEVAPKPKDASPDKYTVTVETTEGSFDVEVTRAWSPNAADRFHKLVTIGYFKDIAIFRAIKGFMFQFGIHGDPKMNKEWGENTFKDDPYNNISNDPGTLTFARTGAPDSRSTQLFINMGQNGRLDKQGFTPFGKIVSGKEVLNKVNTEYGENKAPNFQGLFQDKGNAHAKKVYPNLTYIKSITLK